MVSRRLRQSHYRAAPLRALQQGFPDEPGAQSDPADPLRLPFDIWLRPYDEPVLHDFSLRPLMAEESALLTTATLGNLNWCRERFTATDVRTRPEFAHYTVFDPQRGDFGWMAEAGKDVIGVVWAQCLPPDDPGYGFLAEDIPEVSLWVRVDWRGRGVGRALLRRVQDDARARGVPRLSLSVEADNYAKKLYTAEGFVEVPGRAVDGVMAWNP